MPRHTICLAHLALMSSIRFNSLGLQIAARCHAICQRCWQRQQTRWLKPSVLAAMFLVWTTAAHAATVYHVVAGASGDCLSWAGACSLQDALSVAAPGDEIWIAAGIHTPAAPGGDRAATFQLPNGVALYGGFFGDENLLEERDPDANISVLDGDLDANDGPDFVGYGENSYHVVTADGVDESTLLDGLVITGGHADGEQAPATCFGGTNNGQTCIDDNECDGEPCVSSNSIGAGIFSFSASPTINDCVITANLAAFQGGGMLNKGNSNPIITDTLFSDNRALDNGGAMYNGVSSPVLTRCDFVNNSGGNYAGAICNRDFSNAVMTDCNFIGNTAAEVSLTGGGAILNASSSPSLTRCNFVDNEAFEGFGGAMYNKLGFEPGLGPSNPQLQDCDFTGNASRNGGAMYNIEGSSPTVNACDFTSNVATETILDPFFSSWGGAVYNDNSHPVFTDCTFTANEAFRLAGAISNVESDTTFVNCTFDSNMPGAFGIGGAIYNISGNMTATGCHFLGNSSGTGGALVNTGHTTITTTIFAGNSARTGGAVANASTATYTSCLFVGNTATDSDGGALHNQDDEDGMPVLTNCLFIGNHADGRGGAVYDTSSLDGVGVGPTLINCTLSGNTAGDFGGGIFLDRSGHADVVNSIVWNNSDSVGTGEESQINLNTGTSSPSLNIDNSCVQDWTGALGGSGNIGNDPLFVDADGPDDVLGTDDDILLLTAGSPCVDAGDNSALPADGDDLDGDGNTTEPTPLDFRGGPRIFNGTVEMGVFEFFEDCNENDVPDVEDVASGESTDCSGNGVPDECEVDCNENGIPDACDILSGASEDCDFDNVPDECDCDLNGNGTPDACECLPVGAPLSEGEVITKNRYLSFIPDTPGTGCTRTALRVTLVILPAPFDDAEGTVMWVGPPHPISEASGLSDPDATPPTFTGARLECTPHCMDWSDVGLVHAFASAVVPNARYVIQAIACACDMENEGSYSGALAVQTSGWGDMVGDFDGGDWTPPNGVVDFNDLSAVVGKFKNAPEATIKARADVAEDSPDTRVDFLDIARIVDAFRGVSYPFAGPTPCD